MRVLLAIDESPYSAAAAEDVLQRPWPGKTQLRILTVSPFPYVAMEPWLAPDVQGLDVESKKRAETFVADAATRFRERGFDVEAVVREGDPRMTIVDEATQWDADLVVVGSHGYSGIRRLLLGSVAQYVVAHAPCSVEVVRRTGES